MNYLLKAVTEDVFRQKVTIRFNNINEGFNRFENFVLQNSMLQNFMLQDSDKDNAEARLIDFIEKSFELNGEDNSYVDFYLSRLGEEDKNKLFILLNEEDKEIIKEHMREIKDGTIYFRLNKEIIPFLTRLNTREVFFCTFYFTKFQATLWGNYDMKFPMFFNSKEVLKKYGNVAEECGIEING